MTDRSKYIKIDHAQLSDLLNVRDLGALSDMFDNMPDRTCCPLEAEGVEDGQACAVECCNYGAW